jgi:predicted permease
MLLRDLRFALRSLKKSPGFVAVAVLSLGLGLGLTTTMFALLDAVTHPYVPYRDAERLYRISWVWSTKLGLHPFDVFAAVRDRTRSFEAVLPVVPWFMMASESGEMQQLQGTVVPARFFAVLGVRARLGRTLTDADAGRDVAVVSDALWRHQFAGRRALAGATVTIGAKVYAVAGVMARGMDFPFSSSVWLPMSDASERTGAGLGSLNALVKVKPGVTRAAADSDLAGLARQLTAQYHMRGAPFWIALYPVRDDPMQLHDIHYAMLGAALTVLLIACANLANLMLARGLAKRREVALRLAVGASRSAVVWQMFAECVVLTVVGAALGVVLSFWGASIITNRVPRAVWFIGTVAPQLSWRVFALSAAAAAGAAAFFGLLPAIRVANAVSLDEPLKDGAGTTGRLRHRYSSLAISEVALALALLMGAGLLLKVVHRLSTYDYNFPARQLLQGYAWNRDSTSFTTPERRWQFQLAAVAALKSVAGVADAAAESYQTPPGKAVTAEMENDSTRLLDEGAYPVVTPSYLRTMGLPVLEGRDFVDGDLVGNGAVILNSVAAARLYPHQHAVGRMLKLGAPASNAPWVPIVGICRAALVPYDPGNPLDVRAEPAVYVVRAASVGLQPHLLVRAMRDPEKLAVPLDRTLRSLGPRVNGGMFPYLYGLQSALASRTFLANLFVTMGSFALILAAVGIYGVLAYAVNRRLREFAVRVALGAQRSDLLKAVMHDGLVMTLAGTGLGAFVALWSSYLLESFLEDVYPTDVLTLVLAECVLIVVTIAACLAPALRAMRADPIEILRAT